MAKKYIIIVNTSRNGSKVIFRLLKYYISIPPFNATIYCSKYDYFLIIRF